METRTYRAKSIQEALALIRRDLGPDASVLHTREVTGSVLRWMTGSHQLEVTASADIQVPSRIEQRKDAPKHVLHSAGDRFSIPVATDDHVGYIPPAHEINYRAKFRNNLKSKLNEARSVIEDLCEPQDRTPETALRSVLQKVLANLLHAEIEEQFARDLIKQVNQTMSTDCDTLSSIEPHLVRIVEECISESGPTSITPGKTRVVALVGPTGVGKTTTTAKLAANFHLRERARVGLITVDTFRIAAVDQLRSYADIMDLPMEVVSTPSEMGSAVERLSHLDLILIDSAGQSPNDEAKVQELKSLLVEASADEVHLVLSVVADQKRLQSSVARFAGVGPTSLVLTKLDEADRLGNLLPLLQSCELPISYMTNGQNVPDDIRQADKRMLARRVLNVACGD